MTGKERNGNEWKGQERNETKRTSKKIHETERKQNMNITET